MSISVSTLLSLPPLSPLINSSNLFFSSQLSSHPHTPFHSSQTTTNPSFSSCTPHHHFYSNTIHIHAPVMPSVLSVQMAKMNINFILSPEAKQGTSIRTSDRPPTDRPSERPAQRSRDRPSDKHPSERRQNDKRQRNDALNLEYIAPHHSGHERSRHRRQHQSSSHPSNHPSSSHNPNPSSSNHIQSHSTDRSKANSKNQPPKSQDSKKKEPEKEKRHACPSCDRTFFKLEQLKRHDRLVHLNLRPFICATCDLSFGTKQNMQVHLTTRKHRHRLETLNNHRNSNHSQYTPHSSHR